MKVNLFRRREVVLPTVWGSLLLFSLLIALVVLVGRNLESFLAQTAPVGARTLVVEGWMDSESLDQAIEIFRRGGYSRIVTTGGPSDETRDACGFANYAEQAADYLRKHGLHEADITAVPGPRSKQDRTFLSAVTVREWAAKTGVRLDAMDIVSDGPHARRTRILYEMAFGPTVAVGIHATQADAAYRTPWWTSAQTVRYTIDQAIVLLWVECCFKVPAPGSHEERWAIPRPSP